MTAHPSDQPESAPDEAIPPPTAPSDPPPAVDADPPTEAPAPPADPPAAEPDTMPDTPTTAEVPEAAPALADLSEAPASENADASPAETPVVDEPADDQPIGAPEGEGSGAADAPVAGESADEQPAEEQAADGAPAPEGAGSTDAPTEGDGGRKKKRKKGKGQAAENLAAQGDRTAQDKGAQDKGSQEKGSQEKGSQEKKKPSGPDPVAITKQIGKTSEAALTYVKDPDPKLSRMARKHREAVITEIPPVTAGALLGPEALCRHFLASAASGRYRDLFFLWELFVAFPDDCKPVLAARQRAQEKARAKLRTATHLGLLGDASRVAADVDRATGLPWRWLREILEPMGPAIQQRPAVLAAVLRRIPDFELEVPGEPSDRWLAEAAALKESGADIPAVVDALLGANADRLPATVATLSMAQAQYPDRVPALIDRVDLEARDIAAIMAWARDHGHGEQLTGRVAQLVEAAAGINRATGLATWKTWQSRGVDVAMPESLATPDLEGLDLGRPESAELIKTLVDGGADLDPQAILDQIASGNRMLGEKAFEAFVCAGFDTVHLPLALEGNPMVRPETRCPACQAWTWVRPGLEKRCPRTGCPLRSGLAATAEPSPEEALATIDAAVAGIAPAGDATDAPASGTSSESWAHEAAAEPPARPAQAAPPPPRPQAQPSAPVTPPAPTEPAPPAPTEPAPAATEGAPADGGERPEA